MLKASQKSQFNKLVKNKASQGINLPLRTITSHSVYLENNLRNEKLKHTLDNYARYEKHIGVFKMNREHRFNTLTPNYIKDLKRFLTTLHQDNEVKIILMSGAKEEHFSNGTDFRTILHYQQEQQFDKLTDYLKDLYSLQTLTAKINKPIIGVAHGHAFNSGATMLQATGIPTSTLDSKIAFNEVQFGFVPHGGASFYMSRLPGELGTYFALTGLPMSGVDARLLGMTDMLIHKADKYKYLLADIMDNIEFPMPTGLMLANYEEDIKPAQTKYQHMSAHFDGQHENRLLQEAARRQHKNMYFSEFAEPRDRIPETVGVADMKYQVEMLKFDKAQDYNKGRGLGYFDAKLKCYQNYFSYVTDYVKEYTFFEFNEGGDNLKRHIQAIDRCFYANTVEEIMENLKRENTAFSLKCLEQMNKNSMLSMKLALKMLRQSKNLCYKGCLQNEINVSLNKIQDKDFELGIKEVLMKPGKNGSSPNFNKNVSEDEVNSYFRPNKFTEAVELDIVEKALLPTRLYYTEWTDQVRLWINEESTPQEEVRTSFEFELQQALQARGIDLRDRALDIPTARNYLYHQEQLERLKKNVAQRMEQMATDTKLRESYYEKVNDEIVQLEQQPKEFYSLVNKHIQEIFESAYIEKLQTVYSKSAEIHNLEKRRMFLRFKKFLMSSRIITFADDKIFKLTERQFAMPYKEPHLTENWEKSFLTQQHPEIETSIIHHISKVVGKRTIAPLEVAKQYLTNPQLAKELTLFTFDKEELEKLRRDILENPVKYEKMLTSNASESYHHFPNKYGLQEIRDNEWIYWYRVLNDGKSPFDNLPNYKNYEVYKEFVSNVEKKALSTLELVVQRLINDFEEVEGFNKIVEFGPKEKETKRVELQRLMGVITEVQPQKERNMVRSPKNDNGELIKSTRSLDDVQRIVQKIVREDQQLKALIPSEEGLEKNPLIQNFRSELLDRLYSHIEFVLLNQHESYPVSKKVLEERLASITNPQNIDDKNAQRLAKLGVIDQFLSDHSAEQTIKQALQLTKTFFLHEASAMVEELGIKIMGAFRVDVLASQYLQIYNMMINHSVSLHDPAVKKLISFHSERDRQRYMEQILPTQSLSFYTKNMINMLGDSLYDKNIVSTSRKEAALENSVREKQKGMQELKKAVDDMENSYIEDSQKFSDLQIKKQTSDYELNEEINNDPQMGIADLKPAETLRLTSLDDAIGESSEILDDNMEKIIQEMQVENWLNVVWALQTQHGVECKKVYRFGFKQDVLDSMDFDQDLKQAMGRQDATFENVAELAGYTKQLIEAYRSDLQSNQNIDNMEAVYNFYIGQTTFTDEISQQSIFEKLSQARREVNQKDNDGTSGSRIRKLREDILDFQKLQEIQQIKQECRESIDRLLPKAPQRVQNQVRELVDSNSPYIDLEKIQNALQNKKYEKFNGKSSQFIDQRIFKKNLSAAEDLYNKLMADYKQLPCDAVSLAVAREAALQSKKQSKSALSQTESQVRNQVIHVLDYINDQCQHIPNERRKQISLGEFMKRHPFLNAGSSLSSVANQILREKIERSLGKQSDEAQSGAPIEWEYAGYVSNPFSHEFKNKQVLEAARDEKGVNDSATIDREVNLEFSSAPDHHDYPEYTTRIIDEITGVQHVDDSQRIILDQVLLDAYNMVKVKSELGHIKEKYRSELLNAYTQIGFTDQDIAEIINEYTELRFKDLMMNDKFREAINGPHKTYYLRVLREEIAEDLDIHQEFETDVELQHERFHQSDTMLYDAESIHNMSDLSNTQAVGFDNIEERSADPSQNRKLAHQTLFDELLGEYFLQKRQQVVNINELMDKLALKFTEDNADFLRYQPNEESYSKDPYHTKGHLTQFNLINGQAVPVAYSKLVQDQDKYHMPIIDASAFTDLMDLDIATAKALEKGKNGLGPELQLHNLEDDFSIPEYLPMFDVRRPVNEYVDDKLRSILDDVFEIRKRLEKSLTRNELTAYDKALIRHLTLENLIPRIKTLVNKDKNMIEMHGHDVEADREGLFNDFKQASKQPNKQKDENEGIITEDSLFKYLSYSAMLEKTRREKFKTTKSQEKEAYELNMFDEYYKGQLLKDAKKPQRPINEEVFHEHKNIPVEAIREGYIPIKQRKDVYFAGFQKYKENKKEGYDRNKLFYVFEQYFSKTQQDQAKGDQLNDAQKAITDYFQNPENTQFFMRNKIS